MAQTRIRLGPQIQQSSATGSIITSNTSNEAQWQAPSSGADHLWGFQDSTGTSLPILLDSTLEITGTTLSVVGGGGGYSVIQEEGSTVGPGNNTLNFVGTGFTAADAGGGVTSLTLDSTLNALASYNTNGILTQTAADTFTGRTITGSTDRISVTFGDGVSGNPLINIAGTYVGQASINTLGTITTGQWAATPVDEIYGGTGRTTYVLGDILYASGASTLDTLAVGSEGEVLMVTSGLPAWEQLSSADLSDAANIAYLDGNQTFTGTNVFSENITLNGTPSVGTDVVNIDYLTTILASQRRITVSLYSGSNLTLSGEQTIDSVLTSSSRILLNGQTDPAENGVYVTDAGAWSRATDMDAANEVDGTFVVIADGTTYAGTLWVTTSDVVTLDTDPITFTRIQTAVDLQAGDGIDITALTISAVGVSGDITVGGSGIGLATTAVTPGSYGSATEVGTFTVDSKGRLTAAGNTTIAITSGNITDIQEYVEDTVGALVSNTTGVTWTYTDGAGTLEVDVDTLYSTDGSIPAATTRIVNFDDNASELIFVDSADVQLIYMYDNGMDFMDSLVYITPSTFNVDGTGGSLEVGADFLISLSSTASSTITDNRATTVGLQYAADYSADFTDRTLVDKQYVDDAITGVTTTVNRYFIESSTGTTFDLDAGGGVIKDVDGNNEIANIPADHDLIKIYRNGILQNETGALTTRDYSVNHTTHVLTLETALTASEVILIEITQ